MMATRQILFSFAAAAVVHLGALLIWIMPLDSEGAIAEGQEGLQVSVGLVGSFIATPEKNEKSPVEAPRPEQTIAEETREQTISQLEPESKSEPKPEPESKPEPKPVPKPAPNPEPKPAEKQQPQPESAPARSEAPSESEQQSEPSQSQTRATGVGKRVETGGNPAVRQSYLARVMARVARFKRYPRSARKDGVTGVVLVKFIIRKSGKVESAEVINSSGDSRLDREAVEMLVRASPFASVPDDLSSSHLELTLPVEFSLNPTRKLF